MERTFTFIGALCAGLGVALGAFAAHALADRLEPGRLAVFETGVRYQLVHALAILFTAFHCRRAPGRLGAAAGWLFIAGIVLFSFSLYALAVSGARGYGAVTPFGGVSFLAGWVCLAISALRRTSDSAPTTR